MAKKVKCPVCSGSGKISEEDLITKEHSEDIEEQTVKGLEVVGDPGNGEYPDDYTATVVFYRSGCDDHSVVTSPSDPKWEDKSMPERLALQIAAELQQAYDLLHMGGHFRVVKIENRV